MIFGDSEDGGSKKEKSCEMTSDSDLSFRDTNRLIRFSFITTVVNTEWLSPQKVHTDLELHTTHKLRHMQMLFCTIL